MLTMQQPETLHGRRGDAAFARGLAKLCHDEPRPNGIACSTLAPSYLGTVANMWSCSFDFKSGTLPRSPPKAEDGEQESVIVV